MAPYRRLTATAARHRRCLAAAMSVAVLGLAAGPATAGEAGIDALLGAGLAEDGLAGIRGGEAHSIIDGNLAINDSHQAATITGNGIFAPTTSGAITGNAIQSNRGLTISTFNSGNFNAFQTTVQYNISLQ